jgi:hypothetical protein
MNWKNLSLRRLRWKTLLLGGMAGVWGAFLEESARVLVALAKGPAELSVLPQVLLGLGLGLALAPMGELLRHSWSRGWKAAALGGLLGALVGLAQGGVAVLILPRLGVVPLPGLPGLLGRVAEGALWLGLFAGAAGLGSGLALRNRALALRRLRSGVLAGLILGIAPAAAELLWPQQHWFQLGAFFLWGAIVAQVLFWMEMRFARHWMRVLTGPGEDEFYPLINSTVRLGKADSNEIPLPHYQEVFPVHCQLQWKKDHYDIIDDELGGTVFVNFRQVQEQTLKSGDLVKIGSALLQYGEAS